MISRSFRYFSFEHDLFLICGVLLYISFWWVGGVNPIQFFLIIGIFLFPQDPLCEDVNLAKACILMTEMQRH